MMKAEKQELLEELETEYNKMANELNLTSSLDDLDEIFFIKDFILQVGFISPTLSRVITTRITDNLAGTANWLHGLLLPNVHSMFSVAESELFNEKEKEEIKELMISINAFAGQNWYIGITKNKEKEAQYIDGSVALWKKAKEQITIYLERIIKHWEEETKKEK